MGLLTTCIGAYPKPDFVTLPDWFNIPSGPDTANPTMAWESAAAALGDDLEVVLSRGVAEVIDDQVRAGIDIPTDGEVSRENYIHYHCRHIEGIDFERLTEKSLRNGAYSAFLPTIVARVRARARFLAADYRRAQACTNRPVKITLPGPMTIADTTANTFYQSPREMGADLAAALNQEVLSLAEAGCRHIQIDEPVFARRPDAALEYGMENLERAFHGCPQGVVRTVHMCCGYPDRLDHPNYPKADPDAYSRLAAAIDASSVDAVSLEDAHRHNDLALLEMFAKTTVVLGVVAIAKSHIESVDEIRARLTSALDHIDTKRLIAAPDCGLGLLGRDRSVAKLTNMCEAARSIA
ncbi:MAG: cobalamin-independent methionine synthase II family protein [Gammaproteobacteria bacterium]|nr:cobalamin-independent methionine synthase II family protein [Gammaproteobacteria bacterium]MDH3469054.1 cobalamin-independent methionine synthase II family protein [Gammaproteobacteria bacterium]